jgi:hypothetical protein
MSTKRILLGQLSLIIILGFIVSGVHGYYNEHQILSAVITSIAGIGIIILAVLVISKILGLEIPPPSPIDTIDSQISLVFDGAKGQIAKYTKTQLLKINQDNVSSMVEKGFQISDGRISDFQVSDNQTINVYSIEKNIDKEVEVFFKDAPQKGQLLTRWIKCTFYDCFPTNEEWFEIRIGRKIKHLDFTVIPPNERPIKDYRLILRYQSANIDKKKEYMTHERIICEGNRINGYSSIKLHLTKPKVGTNFRVVWIW